MSAQGKAGGVVEEPFSIAGHEWIPHEWLGDFPADSIVRNLGPGKLALVRVGKDQRHTKTVFEHALDGDASAIETLVLQTIEGCQVLRQLAKTKPELLRPYSRKGWQWPFLKSLHPKLSDDHEAILKTLQQGKDTPLEIDRCAKWKRDAATDIAFALLNYLWQSQKPRRRKDEPPGRIGTLADKLPEFDSDTAPQYWEIAKRILLFTYPDPEKIPELASLVTAPTHRKSPGKMRQQIFDKLRARFLAISKTPLAYQT